MKFFCTLCLLFQVQALYAQNILISTTEQLLTAFRQAVPGTKLLLLPGNYEVYRLETFVGGTAKDPILVEANVPGTVFISATGSEAISIRHPYWIIKDLTIKGKPHSDHAIHITDNADNVIIKQNVLIDFHSQIKVNGSNGEFADNGIIENNDIFNTKVRETDQPVTSIDIVGGKNWIVRGNYIADFAKGLDDKTSYGLFLKGNSFNGLVENNLVICSKSTTGGVRIGMSFGGGGTAKEYCENQDCNIEHTGGVMQNNIVLNCSDVGIYLNKARDSFIEHNTLLMTLGIDVRYLESSAVITNNILTGAIRERDSGKAKLQKNATFGTSLGMWLPTLNSKLQLRISDYDSKFPSLITKENVETVQKFIDSFFSYFEKTFLGLGQNETMNCFPEMIIGNLKPDTAECGTFWQNDSFPTKMQNDFWGNQRSLDPNIMGAIDFYHSSCDITNRIQRKENTAHRGCME